MVAHSSSDLGEPSPTSADACGEVTGCVPAAKRLACVVPEVDLGECALHLPLQKANKGEPTLVLQTNRRDLSSRRFQKQGYQWPQKRTCVRQKLKKKVCRGFSLGGGVKEQKPPFLETCGFHGVNLLKGFSFNSPKNRPLMPNRSRHSTRCIQQR